MNPTELRIGNWVNLYEGRDSKVTGMTNTGKVWAVVEPYDPACAWSTSEINPIPLTEDWLKMFGFEKQYGIMTELGFELKCRPDDTDCVIMIDLEVSIAVIESHDLVQGMTFRFPKHVHQLQNLYFALTGEELELK
jgi:hypothetical protein